MAEMAVSASISQSVTQVSSYSSSSLSAGLGSAGDSDFGSAGADRGSSGDIALGSNAPVGPSGDEVAEQGLPSQARVSQRSAELLQVKQQSIELSATIEFDSSAFQSGAASGSANGQAGAAPGGNGAGSGSAGSGSNAGDSERGGGGDSNVLAEASIENSPLGDLSIALKSGDEGPKLTVSQNDSTVASVSFGGLAGGESDQADAAAQGGGRSAQAALFGGPAGPSSAQDATQQAQNQLSAGSASIAGQSQDQVLGLF